MFKETVDGLDDRSRNGKTASLLIDSAQAQLDEERQTAKAQLDKERQVNSELVRQLHKSREHIRSDGARRDKLQEEVNHLRSPKRSTQVDDGVTYRYIPHDRDTGSTYRSSQIGLWRMDEIESAINHLRVAGASDDTRVTVSDGVLRASLDDDGQTPTPWSYTPEQAPPTFLDRLSRVSVWLSPLLAAVAVFGWVVS